MTPQQRLFAVIYHAGSLILIVSCLLQILRRIDALYPSILGVGFSRICLAAWQVARPDCSKTERTHSGLIFNIVTWASAMVLLIWARRYGAGA